MIWRFASFLNGLKDYRQAKIYYDKVLELDKDGDWRWSHNACAEMLRDNLKDYKESEKFFVKCLEISPNSVSTHSSYGYLLYLVGKYDLAMKHIRIALKENHYSRRVWTYFYEVLVNEAIGNDGKMEQGLLKVAELITKTDDNCSYLLKMKNNDNRKSQCYDRLLELLSSK